MERKPEPKVEAKPEPRAEQPKVEASSATESSDEHRESADVKRSVSIRKIIKRK